MLQTRFSLAKTLSKPQIALEYSGTGEPLIMLHGIGGNRTNWWDQIQFFQNKYRAIAWDARGYGDSDDFEGDLNFEDFPKDLTAVFDHFQLETAHIVGLSMGGRIAMRFAALYPNKVKSLCLVDTHLGFQKMDKKTREDFIASRKEPLLSGKETKDIAPAVAESLCSSKAIPGAKAKFIESMSHLHKESYIKAIESSVNDDRFDEYHKIKSPTIVIVGEDDKLTPLDMAIEIQKNILGADLSVVPNAGHLSNFEQPNSFNTVLATFLSKQI